MDSVPTAVVTVCDYREVAKENLEDQLQETLSSCQTPLLLWTARRPKKRWFEGKSEHRPLVLASSERFEQILWLAPGPVPSIPQEWKSECQALLRNYPQLYIDGDFPAYRSSVEQHILRQEKTVFPEFLRYLPDAKRALQEVGYEHRGLEASLEKMPRILQAHRSGVLSSRERERFDLDFYHLLEHNLERKVDAIYPALVALRK